MNGLLVRRCRSVQVAVLPPLGDMRLRPPGCRPISNVRFFQEQHVVDRHVAALAPLVFERVEGDARPVDDLHCVASGDRGDLFGGDQFFVAVGALGQPAQHALGADNGQA